MTNKDSEYEGTHWIDLGTHTNSKTLFLLQYFFKAHPDLQSALTTHTS